MQVGPEYPTSQLQLKCVFPTGVHVPLLLHGFPSQTKAEVKGLSYIFTKLQIWKMHIQKKMHTPKEKYLDEMMS